MSSERNKAIVRNIYAALADGDNSVFAENVAVDYTWRVAGQCSWSGEFKGRDAVSRDLLRPLFSRFGSLYKATLKSIIAEGDIVVAEVQGDATTAEGKDYNNDYCFIFRFRGDKICAVTEYGDTDLEERVLGSYQDAVARLRA